MLECKSARHGGRCGQSGVMRGDCVVAGQSKPAAGFGGCNNDFSFTNSLAIRALKSVDLELCISIGLEVVVESPIVNFFICSMSAEIRPSVSDLLRIVF